MFAVAAFSRGRFPLVRRSLMGSLGSSALSRSFGTHGGAAGGHRGVSFPIPNVLSSAPTSESKNDESDGSLDRQHEDLFNVGYDDRHWL